MVRLGRTIITVFCLAWLSASAAWSYEQSVVTEATRAAETLGLDLKTLEAGVNSSGVNEEQLTKFRDQVEGIRSKAAAAVQTLVSPIAEVTQQLSQLGQAPEAGKSEPEPLAAQRKLLVDELNRLLGPKSQLDLIEVGAEQLSGRISSIQRDQFVTRIFESGRSVLNPYLWYDTGLGLGVLWTRIAALLSNWWEYIGKSANFMGLWLIPVYLLLFSGVLTFLRRLYARWTAVDDTGGRGPADIGRLWRIVRGMASTFAMIVLLFVPVYLAFRSSGLMTSRFQLLFTAIADIVISTVIYYRLARLLTAPGQPQWRLIEVDDAAAKRLTLLAGIAAFISVGNEQLIKVADALFLPVNYTIGHAALAALLILGLMAFIILTFRSQEGLPSAEVRRRSYFSWAKSFVPTLWLLIAIGLLALLLGYVSFANYLAQNLLNTALLLVILYLIHYLSDAAAAESFYPESAFGRRLRKITGLGERAIERLGLLFRVVVDVLLVAIGIPALLAVWTLTWLDLRSFAITTAQGLQIGEFTLSPRSVLVALLFLFGGLVLTNLLIRWLDRRVLSETRIDKGVQDSLRKGATYAGYALAALAALSAGGLEFSNLAIIAGALGVGIGFGLQSIVNNFVSGLILLAERPVRVGDWVAMDAGEGIVKRINVRSTEIETFDSCTVIIPNSSLITGAVRNWTHGDTMGRFTVAVTVAYGSDPAAVTALLLDVARSHPKVLTFPEPQVQLVRFGLHGLDFEIKANVADIFEGALVASDLRHVILARFGEKAITIPLPPALSLPNG